MEVKKRNHCRFLIRKSLRNVTNVLQKYVPSRTFFDQYYSEEWHFDFCQHENISPINVIYSTTQTVLNTLKYGPNNISLLYQHLPNPVSAEKVLIFTKPQSTTKNMLKITGIRRNELQLFCNLYYSNLFTVDNTIDRNGRLSNIGRYDNLKFTPP